MELAKWPEGWRKAPSASYSAHPRVPTVCPSASHKDMAKRSCSGYTRSAAECLLRHECLLSVSQVQGVASEIHLRRDEDNRGDIVQSMRTVDAIS
jgi:hypothetical protein